jgi:type IV pilus assembly protein PilW
LKPNQNYSMRKVLFSTPRLAPQTGFTLVELMISLVLGLLLVAGVLNILNSNKENYRVTENLARIQENARVSFDLMSRDVREAGELSCGSKLVANVLRSGSSTIPWWADWNAGTLRGYAGSQDVTDIVAFGTATNSRVTGTDAILVMQSSGNEANITAHDTASADFTLTSVSNFANDDVAVACDLQSAALFQVATVSSSSKKINYEKSFTTLNCGNGLAYPTPLACATTTIKIFSATSGQVAKLNTSFWYIGVGSNGKNSLYKTRISKKTVGGATQIIVDKDEVLPNVQDMKIQYLTKNLTTGILASSWINADDTLLNAANGAWTEDNVNQVIAARFELTLQSDESVSTNNTPLQRQLIFVVGLRSRDTLYQASP